ncbi:transporter, partial [Pedobacter sp. MC2016-24]|nr:transporter [Pedobacter sp. MC2016-24]
ENKHEYSYGNKFTTNVLAYYKFRIANKVTVAPNVGVLYETADKDVENKKYDVAVSGGYSLSAVGGVEVAMKRLSFGANYQNVRSQDLAGGRAYAGNRMMVHMSIPF